MNYSLISGSACALFLCHPSVRRFITQFFLRMLLRSIYKPNHSKLYFMALKMLGGKKPSLWHFQECLPSLPVPELRQTCSRWLQSVKPLLTKEEYEDTEKLVSEFLEKDGPELQKLLMHRFNTTRNWLSEYWLEFAYLRWRGPLPVNINFYGMDPMWVPPRFSDQCKEAAYLISRSLQFKKKIDKETLTPIRMNGVVPIDMDGYRYIYGTTRIPGKDKDVLRTYKNAKSAHVLVCIGSSLFVLPVQVDGKYASMQQIETGLCDALREAEQSGRWNDPNISIMTSENRDTWAGVRSELLDISSSNQLAMEAIETALFAVVLHEGAPTKVDEDPVVATNKVNRTYFMGDGKHYWFDKNFSFIVFENGRSGFNVEHTWADAPILCHHMEYVYCGPDCADHEGVSVKITPQKIQWQTNSNIQQALQMAQLNFDAMAKTIALRTVIFKGFGKELAKRNKLSPDSVAQAVLQLSALKYFGRPVLTYESASTRMFYLGRTETIRSCTMQMFEFSKAMKENADSKQCLALLRTASKFHTTISRDAGFAQGVDRHLLGLKLTAILNGKPIPDLFKGVAYQQEYRLSTSQSPLAQEYLKLPVEKLVNGGGFGPTATDGVGVSYHILPEMLYFNVSANGSQPEENVTRFVEILTESLQQMQQLLS